MSKVKRRENTTILENTDSLPATRDVSTMDIAISRAAQEVQAAMVIAKKFPRNQEEAITKIMTHCSRLRMAQNALYTFPRGDTIIEEPNIRMAEVLAQSWGNIDSGVIELERKTGESIAMAYCWDLETNTRDTKIFTVRHLRDTRHGVEPLYDERDIYELVANMGARRKRACILAVIPRDIVDMAQDQVNKTLQGDSSEPLIDRIRKMAIAFNTLGIPTSLIEKRLRHRLDVTSANELITLRKIYQSIKDGVGKPEDYFDFSPESDQTRTEAVLKKIEKSNPLIQENPATDPEKDVSSDPDKEISPLDRMIARYSEFKQITAQEGKNTLERASMALKKKPLAELTEEEINDLEKMYVKT